MPEDELTVFCMTPTPFREGGATIDEEALREHLSRLAEAGNAIYLSSGGAGEAHVLDPAEMRQVCDIAVDALKGRVALHAGLRESRSANALEAIARPAIDAGVDVVQLYQLDGGHGMVPTLAEQEAYWDDLLTRIQHPVAISVHYEAKFQAPVSLLNRLCRDYPHVRAFSLVHCPPKYFLALRDSVLEVRDDIDFHVAMPELLQFSALGATGAINPAGNVIPYTIRRLGLSVSDGDLESASAAALQLQKFLNIVGEWAPSTARWVKMSMKVLGLGNGVLRPPYLLPPPQDQARMAEAFEHIGLLEFEEASRQWVDARLNQ